MGAEVQRVPTSAAVEPLDELARASFGEWLRRQRELRGISVFFVAARTKLSSARITALEEGAETLGSDGHSRATARGLALAVGADADEAVRHLGGSAAAPRARPSRVKRLRGPWLLRTVWVLLAGLSAWLASAWLSQPPADASDAPVVYKPDYVERLIEEPRGEER